MPKRIEISILGKMYDSIADASHTLGISVDMIRTRLDSQYQNWKEWKYLGDPPGKRLRKPRAEDTKITACYRFIHVDSGCFYVGSTCDLLGRKYAHLSYLRHGTHHSPKVQELWDKVGDAGQWRWEVIIFNTKEEARAEEQKFLDTFKDNPLLLNNVFDANSPISEVAKRPGYKERHALGMKEAEALMTEEERLALKKRRGQGFINHWANKDNRAAWKGAGNPFAKKVIVDGVVYGSVKDAQATLGINEKTIRKRANSDAYPNYSFDVTQM